MKFDDSLWKGILEDLFADFLRFFFSNADPGNNINFDEAIDTITPKSRHMGIVEMIKERETRKILQKGRIEGKAEGKTEVVRNLITKLGFSDAQVADVAEVSVSFVKKVRTSLKKKK